MPQAPPSLARLGEVIVEHRTRLAMTQRELAARSKLHVNYVCGIERGSRNPTVVVLGRIAGVLETEVWRLLKDAGL